MISHAQPSIATTATPLHGAKSNPSRVLVSVPSSLTDSLDIGDDTVAPGGGLTLTPGDIREFIIPSGDVLHGVSNGVGAITIEVVQTTV